MLLNRYASFFIPFCWLFLWSYWIVAALRTKAVVEKQSLQSRIVIRVLVISAYICVFSGWRDIPVLGFVVIPHSPIAALAGMVFCAGGSLCAIWARYLLAGNWSGNITLKKDHELIERGPYAFVRHPIYAGFFMMFIGTAIASPKLGNFLGLLFALIAFGIKSRQEEALMLRHFPDKYPAYIQRTKRLIPFVF